MIAKRRWTRRTCAPPQPRVETRSHTARQSRPGARVSSHRDVPATTTDPSLRLVVPPEAHAVVPIASFPLLALARDPAPPACPLVLLPSATYRATVDSRETWDRLFPINASLWYPFRNAVQLWYKTRIAPVSSFRPNWPLVSLVSAPLIINCLLGAPGAAKSSPSWPVTTPRPVRVCTVGLTEWT